MANTQSRNKVRLSGLDRIVAVIPYLVVTLLCLLILLPYLNVLALSLNDGKDAARGGVYFWPRVWALDNYREVFRDGSIIRAYRITIARTLLGTLMSLAVTTLAAYALNQTELPGRKFVILAFTFTMLFGGGTIPTYIQYKDLGLLDTFWVYVIPPLVSVTYLIMVRAFFDSLPYGLQEAAKLDGCSNWRFLATIVIPLARPALGALGAYVFLLQWNQYLWPLLVTNSDRVRTVQIGVSQMYDIDSESIALMMSAVIVVLIPSLSIFVFMQKQLINGLMAGAVKG